MFCGGTCGLWARRAGPGGHMTASGAGKGQQGRRGTSSSWLKLASSFRPKLLFNPLCVAIPES